MQEENLNAYIGTKGLILNDKNEVLIVKETYTKDWELPGGKIKNDEIDLGREECLAREIKEELGENFEIEIGEIYDTMFRIFEKPRNPDINKVFLVVFLCKYLGGEILKQEEEVLETAWVNKENYQNYTYVNGYKKVLDRFFANLL